MNEKLPDEIHVKSQQELDAIPADYPGLIVVEFGTPDVRAIVHRGYARRVEARGNASVVARENASVEAWENASVEARENASVEAWGNASVVARGNASVVARGNASVVAWGNASVVARENASVEAWGNASVVARENASVEAWENASVEAWENASVVARGNASVVARGNASVVARENAKIDATGNAQVCDRSTAHSITLSGNARVVYDPRTLAEYLDTHGLDHDEHRGRFFKAVHRDENGYHSDWLRGFRYEIGKTAISACDPDPDTGCGQGIHMSDLGFALCFGASWPDLAILELETNLDVIVFPNGGEKVRTSSATVIREVPLEECGLYGKILAKRIAQREAR